MTNREAIGTLKALQGMIEWDFPFDYAAAIDKAIDALEEARRGTWDERQVESDNIWTRRRFYCSNCGGWQTYGKTKYCPNCGAEMGKGSDE